MNKIRSILQQQEFNYKRNSRGLSKKLYQRRSAILINQKLWEKITRCLITEWLMTILFGSLKLKTLLEIAMSRV